MEKHKEIMVRKSTNRICLMLLLASAWGCANQAAESEGKVVFDCAFNVEDYTSPVAQLELSSLGNMLSWIHRRMLGGISKGQGGQFAKKLKNIYFQSSPQAGSKTRHFIWFIPSEVTKKYNQMNVLVELKGNDFELTRIDDNDRELFFVHNSYSKNNVVFLMRGYCEQH